MTRLSNKSDGGFERVGLAIMPNSGVRQCFCESRSRCGGNLTGRNRDENLRYDELGISSRTSAVHDKSSLYTRNAHMRCSP